MSGENLGGGDFFRQIFPITQPRYPVNWMSSPLFLIFENLVCETNWKNIDTFFMSHWRNLRFHVPKVSPAALRTYKKVILIYLRYPKVFARDRGNFPFSENTFFDRICGTSTETQHHFRKKNHILGDGTGHQRRHESEHFFPKKKCYFFEK